MTLNNTQLKNIEAFLSLENYPFWVGGYCEFPLNEEGLCLNDGSQIKIQESFEEEGQFMIFSKYIEPDLDELPEEDEDELWFIDPLSIEEVFDFLRAHISCRRSLLSSIVKV